MKKIPCLFERDFTDRRNPKLMAEITPGCEWVFAGEGVATRKYDGTAVAIIDGKLYARYDAKRGKIAPAHAIPIGEPDTVTGHHPHWIPADGPEYHYIREAEQTYIATSVIELGRSDGTYEAIGPKINGNHEGRERHVLIRHGADILNGVLRDFVGIGQFLDREPMEGIVFHHPDGRMCKIRRDDYGIPWPVKL